MDHWKTPNHYICRNELHHKNHNPDAVCRHPPPKHIGRLLLLKQPILTEEMQDANLIKMDNVAAALPNSWQETIARNMNFHDAHHTEAFPDAACSPAPSSEVHRSKSLTLEYLNGIQLPLCQRKSYLILLLHT